MISDSMKSNLFTMGVASQNDVRQNIPSKPSIPPEDVRLLRAKLILEEALETIDGLGFIVGLDLDEDFREISVGDIHFDHDVETQDQLADIIDGCVDEIYVCNGTLAACGVPDLPHVHEVNRANNAKFPGGKATFNESGKYLKPAGWQPPNHHEILTKQTVNLNELASLLIKEEENKRGEASV